jgi:predicted permease
MRWLARLRFLVTRWRRSSAHDGALDAELHSYLQADIDARVRAGESPADARRQALIDLGGVEQVKEVVRDRRTGAWVDGVLHDVRYAARTLRKSPGATASIVASVGLGMAAMIVGLAFANAVLFRPIPGIREPERVLGIRVEFADDGHWWNSAPLAANEARVVATGFRDIGAVAMGYESGEPVMLPAARSLRVGFVSSNYFDVLGVGMSAGTAMTETAEATDAVVAVLSHPLWVREFGADPAVIGRTIRVADWPVQVIGVASADFVEAKAAHVRRRSSEEPSDLWVSINLKYRLARLGPATGLGRTDFVVRLRDGRDLSQAQALASTVAAEVAAARGFAPATHRLVVERLGDHERRWWGPLVTVVMPVPFLVLGIACVNAANLLLARAAVREREIAVRLSIGASRGRIVRQLLIESLLLAVASTIAVVPLAFVGVRLAEDALTIAMPIDHFVVGATLAIAALTAVAFGLVPAIRAAWRPPAGGLRSSHEHDATPVQLRTRRVLVIVQVALALSLLASGNQLSAAWQGTAGSVGTPSDRLLMASFNVNALNLSPGELQHFYDALLLRTSTSGGVEAAGLARRVGMWGGYSGNVWRDVEAPRDGKPYLAGYAGGDLFGALGLPIVAGRGFTDADRRWPEPRVAIVNRTFADRVLNGRAIGQMLHVAADRETGASIAVQVVGVSEAAQLPSFRQRERPNAAVYLPAPLAPDPFLTLFVKSATSADALIPQLRALLPEIDPRVAVTEIGSLEALGTREFASLIALGQGLALLGLIALLLATGGLYAVMAHAVGLRLREFAVRFALGADAGAILAMVARQSAVLAIIGASIGMFVSLVVGAAIQAEIPDSVATGVIALIESALLLAVAMLVASLVPAVRASRVNPIVLLKDE